MNDSAISERRGITTSPDSHQGLYTTTELYLYSQCHISPGEIRITNPLGNDVLVLMKNVLYIAAWQEVFITVLLYASTRLHVSLYLT